MAVIEKQTTGEAETIRFAHDLAIAMRRGDLLLLTGDLGAGKTVIARAIVRFLVGDPDLEVPSPTYTLCHEYDGEPSVSHYDLYRLSSIEELDELGWQEQLENGCAIMEWPEKCFDTLPEGAIHVEIAAPTATDRTFRVSASDTVLERFERSLAIRGFLDDSGQTQATRQFLSGDASTRSYEVINGGEYLLMNSPAMPDGPPVRDGKPYSQVAHLAEDVSAFVAIDKVLIEAGIRAPIIHAGDFERGLLLTENFGSEGIIDETRQPIEERYKASIELLAHMHQQTFETRVEYAPGRFHEIPPYDDTAKMIEVELLKDWYLKYETGQAIDEAEFARIWKALFEQVNATPQTLVMRDYHSPNILWLDSETGLDRVGVIDFQDAIIGPEAYDVASLAQDARVDVSAELEDTLVNHYITCRSDAHPGFDVKTFRSGYAIMAAQRATKIMGIFVRLDVRDGKPQYRAHLPRMKSYLKRSLKHPALGEYRQWLGSVIDL